LWVGIGEVCWFLSLMAMLEGCTVLEVGDVHVALQEREEEPDYNEEGL